MTEALNKLPESSDHYYERKKLLDELKTAKGMYEANEYVVTDAQMKDLKRAARERRVKLDSSRPGDKPKTVTDDMIKHATAEEVGGLAQNIREDWARRLTEEQRKKQLKDINSNRVMNSTKIGDQTARKNLTKLRDTLQSIDRQESNKSTPKTPADEIPGREVIETLAGEQLSTQEFADTFGITKPEAYKILSRLRDGNYIYSMENTNTEQDATDKALSGKGTSATTISGGRRKIEDLWWSAGYDDDIDKALDKWDREGADADARRIAKVKAKRGSTDSGSGKKLTDVQQRTVNAAVKNLELARSVGRTGDELRRYQERVDQLVGDLRSKGYSIPEGTLGKGSGRPGESRSGQAFTAKQISDARKKFAADLAAQDRKAATSTDEATAPADAIKAAEKAMAPVIKHEPNITMTVGTVATLHGGSMHKLQYRRKTVESFARKIDGRSKLSRLAGREAALDDEASRIKDSVRYTSLMPTANYWDAGDAVLVDLESRGHKVLKDKGAGHYWPSAGYRGRNVQLEDENGIPYELQFHTKETAAAVEKNHALYERWRVLEEGDPERDRLQREMDANFNATPVPPGTNWGPAKQG